MGKYFTEAERYQLEGFLKAKMKQKDIAHLLNKSPRTIRREIERGTITLINQHLMEYECYCADVAQARYNEKKQKRAEKQNSQRIASLLIS